MHLWVIIRDCFCVRPSLMHVCVFFLSESITGVERRPETLSTHPKPWAASVTGSSTAQTATIPSSYLSETQVNRGFFLACYYFCGKCVHAKQQTLQSLPSIPAISYLQRVSRRSCCFLLYILIMDCRSAERWVHNNNSCLSDLKITSLCPDVFGDSKLFLKALYLRVSVLGDEHIH